MLPGLLRRVGLVSFFHVGVLIFIDIAWSHELFIVNRMVQPPNIVQQGTPRPSVESKCSAKLVSAQGVKSKQHMLWLCICPACMQSKTGKLSISFPCLLVHVRCQVLGHHPAIIDCIPVPGVFGLCGRDSSEWVNRRMKFYWYILQCNMFLISSCPSARAPCRHPPQVHDLF